MISAMSRAVVYAAVIVTSVNADVDVGAAGEQIGVGSRRSAGAISMT
jgi:hypothetical protein